MNAVTQFPMKLRSQTPTAPFPYRDETLAIASADGVTLGATLSIPNRIARPNLVILVHGSGPHTRDETIEGHQTFAVLADYLARQGIAVLRYDKRGIARSTGNYEQHTPQQLAEDLYAVAKSLKARQQFKRIGFIGHSEGPGIAAAVLAKHPNAVDFLVSMAGVGLPGLEMMLLQDRATAKANGATPAEVETIVNYASKYYGTILDNAELEQRMTALHAYVAQESKSKAIADKYKMNQGSLALALADKPFLRELLSGDTSQDWRRILVPVFALNGSLDQQVPVDSMHGIVASLKAGGNKKVMAIALPKLNHLFQTAATGEEEEYAKIDETIAPIALQKIARYVREQK
jgi:pimeloyl-ACP methyl ester carboxylesterase